MYVCMLLWVNRCMYMCTGMRMQAIASSRAHKSFLPQSMRTRPYGLAVSVSADTITARDHAPPRVQLCVCACADRTVSPTSMFTIVCVCTWLQQYVDVHCDVDFPACTAALLEVHYPCAGCYTVATLSCPEQDHRSVRYVEEGPLRVPKLCALRRSAET